MARYTVGLTFLVCLVKISSWAEEQNTTISTEFVKEPTVLHDVSAAKAFISSYEFAVIAFIKDPEEPEIKYFDTLVKNHPEWDFGVSTNEDVLEHFQIESNAVSFFREVDNVRKHFALKDIQQLDTAKLYRILSINELRWVTTYDSVTAIGIMGCEIQVHLLLFMDKRLDNEEVVLEEFRTAAKELQGKVLFVKLDVSLKGNERSMVYLKLNRSDLPKVVIYHTDSNDKDILPDGEFTAERLKSFCLNFLSGKSAEEDSEKTEAKTEL